MSLQVFLNSFGDASSFMNSLVPEFVSVWARDLNPDDDLHTQEQLWMYYGSGTVALTVSQWPHTRSAG